MMPKFTASRDAVTASISGERYAEDLAAVSARMSNPPRKPVSAGHVGDGGEPCSISCVRRQQQMVGSQ
jgi:hypothetical protein